MTVIQLGTIEGRRLQFAIQKDEGSMIFEFSIRCPLHANELGSEHGEPGLAHHHDGSGIGYRVSDFFLRRLDGGVGSSTRFRGGRSSLLAGCMPTHSHGPSHYDCDCGKVVQGITHKLFSCILSTLEGYHLGAGGGSESVAVGPVGARLLELLHTWGVRFASLTDMDPAYALDPDAGLKYGRQEME
jgi:hypothetical protein